MRLHANKRLHFFKCHGFGLAALTVVFVLAGFAIDPSANAAVKPVATYTVPARTFLTGYAAQLQKHGYAIRNLHLPLVWLYSPQSEGGKAVFMAATTDQLTGLTRHFPPTSRAAVANQLDIESMLNAVVSAVAGSHSQRGLAKGKWTIALIIPGGGGSNCPDCSGFKNDVDTLLQQHPDLLQLVIVHVVI